MNKKEFVNVFSKDTGISKKQTGEMLEHFFRMIEVTLQQGSEIKFPGFGSFKISKVKAKTVTNPQNKQKMDIQAYNRVRFIPGKKLKDAVNT